MQAVNPIGTRRKDHMYEVVVARIINFPAYLRDSFDALLLLALFSKKHAKNKGGVCRMLSGVDADTGEAHSEVTVCSELLQLLRGVKIMIPDDIRGGLVPVIMEAHFQGLEGDLLGLAGYGPWPECFQANHPCQDCMWHRNCPCAFLPFNASEPRRKISHSPSCSRMWEPPLRTDAEQRSQLLELQPTKFTNKKKRADSMRDSGFGKVFSVLQYVPGANLSTDAKKDVMHLFLRGLTSHEAFWVCCKVPTRSIHRARTRWLMRRAGCSPTFATDVAVLPRLRRFLVGRLERAS